MNFMPNVIIMATEKNLKTLKESITYVKKNIDHNNIYIISSKKNKKEIDEIEGVRFIDEDTIVPGMNFTIVADKINNLVGSKKRTGWYYQQFLKLGWALKSNDKYYVVIDADTFPLNHIDFVDDMGRYKFTSKIEYNKPYFDTINKLFDGSISRVGDYSFVAEHMAFDSQIVRQMLSEIVARHPEKGSTFFEVILNSISVEDIPIAGFSEFETYGNYVSIKYPELVKMRKLHTLREAAYILGGSPSREQLDWASRDYDIISIEVPDYKDKVFTKISNSKITQNCIRLKTIARLRQNIRSVYRRVCRKKDMRFD